MGKKVRYLQGECVRIIHLLVSKKKLYVLTIFFSKEKNLFTKKLPMKNPVTSLFGLFNFKLKILKLFIPKVIKVIENSFTNYAFKYAQYNTDLLLKNMGSCQNTNTHYLCFSLNISGQNKNPRQPSNIYFYNEVLRETHISLK